MTCQAACHRYNMRRYSRKLHTGVLLRSGTKRLNPCGTAEDRMMTTSEGCTLCTCQSDPVIDPQIKRASPPGPPRWVGRSPLLLCPSPARQTMLSCHPSGLASLPQYPALLCGDRGMATAPRQHQLSWEQPGSGSRYADVHDGLVVSCCRIPASGLHRSIGCWTECSSWRPCC